MTTDTTPPTLGRMAAVTPAAFRLLHGGDMMPLPAGVSGRQFGIVSLQPYLHDNVKLVFKFRHNLAVARKSDFFAGTHFAF